jgi:hypothetical protein
MSPAELGTKNDCAGRNQQQFTQLDQMVLQNAHRNLRSERR